MMGPNTSGRGKAADIPDEIKRWNWGAFFLTWIWGIGNRTFISFLMFVPILNLVFPFVLGARGNEWAWRNKYWKNIDVFNAAQRKWTWVGAIISGISLISGAWYVGILLYAQFDIGGSSPNKHVVGTLDFAPQRLTDDECEGVTVTPQSTWLVGTVEAWNMKDVPAEAKAMNLGDLVYGKDGHQEGSAGIFSRHEATMSYISRLDDQGQFRVAATVNAGACLQASPDGRTVYLRTRLQLPFDSDEEGMAKDRTADFLSYDQGKSWIWQRDGLGPDRFDTLLAHRGKYDVYSFSQKYSHGAHEIWGVIEGANAAMQNLAAVLFYSSDDGKTAELVKIDSSMLATGDHNLDDRVAPSEVRARIIQVNATQAVLWVSQDYSWGWSGDWFIRKTFFVTHQAELRRVDGRWHVESQKKIDNMFIQNVYENALGQVIGVVKVNSESGSTQVVTLDKATLELTSQGPMATLFDPLSASVSRNPKIWMGKNVLVAKATGIYEIPRWAAPFDTVRGDLLAPAIFYSDDWGRSWRHLAIKADGWHDSGIVGFDSARDEVFWAKSDFGSKDRAIYRYRLH